MSEVVLRPYGHIRGCISYRVGQTVVVMSLYLVFKDGINQ